MQENARYELNGIKSDSRRRFSVFGLLYISVHSLHNFCRNRGNAIDVFPGRRPHKFINIPYECERYDFVVVIDIRISMLEELHRAL